MQGDDDEEPLFPEHHFLLACLRMGLTIQDLKFLNYVDILKIFLSIERKKEESKIKNASQADIDRLLG